jgi:hypothetical protein
MSVAAARAMAFAGVRLTLPSLDDLGVLWRDSKIQAI